ncbi:uncharacterized protein HaLaN_25850 [Haematococcus lacustris]|uniref:Uncharacterized protein n=1 Tax=Haematococcus lacustris TaxID=44745 RepID=A0A6A0A4Q2_HAELA|nr:uncharacterized protein HaLaN_25850 [Haematococcus lacustris]
MPVSLERLIAEVEPNVITEALTRDCIQIAGGDPDTLDEKRRNMHFKDIECLAFSFRGLARIDNLKGLHNQPDLARPVVQQDHQDSRPGPPDQAGGSVVVQQPDHRAGKPGQAGQFECAVPRSYVLSHVKDLTYLDYRRVAGADVQAAMEQHQDEMNELQEREEQAALEAKAAQEKLAHNALMKEANLDGVESLVEDMIKEDPEWPRFITVPGLTDAWNDVRDKFNVATEDFKAIILEQHSRKKNEYAEWKSVVTTFLAEKDTAAKVHLTEYEKMKKKAVRAIQASPGDADTQVLGPKVRLMALKDELLDLEQEAVEVLGELLQEFDRSYSEIAESNKTHFNTYFTQIRDLQNNFFAAMTQAAMGMYEKYNQENSDLESLPEDARILLSDKDALINSLQASHDAHTSRIDMLEDRLVSTELRSANDLNNQNALWSAKRNRDRISEIINYIERNMLELDELAGEEDNGEG